MSDISVKRAHGMGLEEAQGKVDEVIEAIQSEFSNLVNSIDWNADKTAAKVKGKGFSGDFKVDDTNVGIDIDLSLFAKPLKGKVQEKIEQRMDDIFA